MLNLSEKVFIYFKDWNGFFFWSNNKMEALHFKCHLKQGRLTDVSNWSCLQETVCAPSASINNDSASSGEKTFGKITVDESSMDNHFEITDINDNDSVASQEESVKTFSELELHMQQDEEEEILRDAEVHHHGGKFYFLTVELRSTVGLTIYSIWLNKNQ
jgi:hypothetical protein